MVPKYNKYKFRDKIASALCNFILRTIASEEYAAWIFISVQRGLDIILKEGYEQYIQEEAAKQAFRN